MSFSVLVSLAFRGSLLLGAAYGAVRVLPNAAAALRRLVLVLGFAAAVALPVIALGLPGRPVARVVPAPGPVRVFAEALSFDDGASSASPVPAAVHSRRPPASASVTTFVTWVWASGVLVTLARLGVGVARAQAMARRAFGEGRRSSPRSASRSLDDRARTVPRPRRPRHEGHPHPVDPTAKLVVATSPDVEVPVVVGFFAPRVLLPVHAEGWSEERLRTVLMHEASHVRRRDGLALLFASFAAALYWFQPLGWLLVRRLRRECELAADEDVLFAGTGATVYAEHLLAVAREASGFAFVVAMAAEPSELARRIRVLVSRERLPARLTSSRIALASAGASLLVAFAACAATAPRAPAAIVHGAAVSGIDPAARAILEEEGRHAKAEWSAARVALVALEPSTGAVLAMSDDDPGRPILPASTLKPIVVAAALDVSAITSDDRFDCGQGTRTYDSSIYGQRILRDWQPYGMLDVREIVAMSSNVGLSRIFDALGGERLARAFRRFHLDGAPAVIEERSLDGAIVALGQRFAAPPLALAAAYGVLANDGRYVAPGLDRARRVTEPVIAEETARAVRQILVAAVSGERATGRAARVEGVSVAGKTGTSDEPESVASFVGIVPSERPRFVILAAVVGAKKEGTGATIAAPLFARVAKRLLGSGT